MIWRWLDTIRRKPKHVREQYAFGVAITFTGLVIALWSFSLPSRFVNTPTEDGVVAAAPFAGLFNEFRQGFGAIKSQTASVFESEVSELTPLLAATSSETDGLPTAQELWPSIATSAQPTLVEIRVATSTAVAATTSVSE